MPPAGRHCRRRARGRRSRCRSRPTEPGRTVRAGRAPDAVAQDRQRPAAARRRRRRDLTAARVGATGGAGGLYAASRSVSRRDCSWLRRERVPRTRRSRVVDRLDVPAPASVALRPSRSTMGSPRRCDPRRDRGRTRGFERPDAYSPFADLARGRPDVRPRGPPARSTGSTARAAGAVLLARLLLNQRITAAVAGARRARNCDRHARPARGTALSDRPPDMLRYAWASSPRTSSRCWTPRRRLAVVGGTCSARTHASGPSPGPERLRAWDRDGRCSTRAARVVSRSPPLMVALTIGRAGE